jgi:hypothetical protein
MDGSSINPPRARAKEMDTERETETQRHRERERKREGRVVSERAAPPTIVVLEHPCGPNFVCTCVWIRDPVAPFPWAKYMASELRFRARVHSSRSRVFTALLPLAFLPPSAAKYFDALKLKPSTLDPETGGAPRRARVPGLR